ncbi:MAG: dihydropteroate synthase [Bifidobacteriaceae bacterium]|jgi:dihydropteroate synthase|nr:dihydropteroate synthase [Bifidobacteriaceae bacterium]
MTARPEGLPDSLASLERPVIVGICNVTPDSFSDGGQWASPEVAIAHGLEMVRAGADVVDVGGESTRPGADRVPVHTEMGRVLPVVAELAARGVAVSIDTMRASVALAAVQAGAAIVNDVSGGLADPAMLRTVARTGAVYILSHWRGHSTVMDELDQYGDVVADVRVELAERLDAAVEAGIDLRRIAIDPGLGFAKTGVHNWSLLARLGELMELGRPVMVGASRKRFLASGAPADSPAERDHATAAVTALAAAAGAWAIRVHEVPRNTEAARIGFSWRAATR